MDDNNVSNFSDIPALGDEQGLNTFLQNEALAAQGIQPVTEQPAAQQGTSPAPANAPAASTAPVQPTGAQAPAASNGQVPPIAPIGSAQPAGGVQLTPEQLAQIAAKVQTMNTTPSVAQRPVVQSYTEQERAFINQALAQGYGLDQINATIMRHRAGTNPTVSNQNAALTQQVEQIKQYLQNQEYQNAQNAFITKLSSFGDKFGLSEQDLVTFGNEAMKKGINIALPNVDFETVFRAVYPDQYRIRMQRMTPTNASQIYGGTSIPESGNRAAASRMEDAYVDSFLKQAMPNQFQMNKK